MLKSEIHLKRKNVIFNLHRKQLKHCDVVKNILDVIDQNKQSVEAYYFIQ